MDGKNNSLKSKHTTDILIIDPGREGRALIQESVNSYDDIRIVDSAPNGNLGLIKAEQLEPDIVILDMGIKDYPPEDLAADFLKKHEHLGIILTLAASPGPEMIAKTLHTLERGAYDFIEKPAASVSHETAVQVICRKLIPKIRSFSIQQFSKIAKNASGVPKVENKEAVVPGLVKTMPRKALLEPGRCRVVVIGVSTGGPKALLKIIPELPSEYPLPIVIVLHIPKAFTGPMASDLDRKAGLHVQEAQEGDILEPGKVYLAPGGIHSIVRKRADQKVYISYDDGPPENKCKPSVDVLFRSVADVFDKEVLALILTGMGVDGVAGMKELKSRGAVTFAQDKESSVVWGMPGTAFNAGVVDHLIPLDEIAFRLTEATG